MKSAHLVWDLPTRCFHWLLAASFLGAWWISESERWRGRHVLLGYTVLMLLAFRLAWGALGGHHSRFRQWPLWPLQPYPASLWRGRPAHHDGHNPAGSWAALALLLSVAGTAVTGWLAAAEDASDRMMAAHRTISNCTLVLVAIHLGGVLISSWLHRENLLAAMIHGKKPGLSGVHTAPRRLIAWLLLATVLCLWTGVLSWPGLPPGSALWSFSTTPDTRGDL